MVTYTLSDLQLAGSWELDLFGKNRAALDSATSHRLVSLPELVRLALKAHVARQHRVLLSPPRHEAR